MKVTINGKEYECQEIKIKTEVGEIVVNGDTDKKKTGYERVDKNDRYYFAIDGGDITTSIDCHGTIDNANYYNANYYSSEDVAKNNIRADKLMRQLRRFSVENRVTDIEWVRGSNPKYFIYYDYSKESLEVEKNYYFRSPGLVCFGSINSTARAIKEFKDELIWYFTEYKDSL